MLPALPVLTLEFAYDELDSGDEDIVDEEGEWVREVGLRFKWLDVVVVVVVLLLLLLVAKWA